MKIHERKSKKVILEQDVKVAKVHHISLGVGIFSSFLRNPTNIRKSAIPNTNDTTLIADDPRSRGMFTIMATYYPKPRNILYPSTRWQEKIGITVRTSLNKDQFENFFIGGSYDIARGLGFVAGIHYGRRTVVSHDKDFDFGDDILPDPSQPIITNETWAPSLFIGTVIDIRVFEALFRPSISN